MPPPHISSEGTNTFLSNETNVRAALSTYYLGTGPRDIRNSLGFYGIPGGHSFHGLYYGNMDEINENVMEICEEIVQEGLVEEIKAQIKKQLGDKYTAEEVKEYTHNFFMETGFIPEEILIIAITASYDMGWNQRSTGRI